MHDPHLIFGSTNAEHYIRYVGGAILFSCLTSWFSVTDLAHSLAAVLAPHERELKDRNVPPLTRAPPELSDGRSTWPLGCRLAVCRSPSTSPSEHRPRTACSARATGSAAGPRPVPAAPASHISTPVSWRLLARSVDPRLRRRRAATLPNHAAAPS